MFEAALCLLRDLLESRRTPPRTTIHVAQITLKENSPMPHNTPDDAGPHSAGIHFFGALAESVHVQIEAQ